jgi:Zn-finger nucleic acid-binding protein
MGRLIRCDKCERTYDATAKAEGTRFHCHCGAELEVVEARGHDASVVRCSACGSTRPDTTRPDCGYCGASFTLADRDLGAVCPKCLARVSTKAKFCHHCGAGMTAEHVAGEATEQKCPVCGDEAVLIDRTVGGTNMLECERCMGLWLGHKTFTSLRREAKVSADTFEGLDMALKPTGERISKREQTGPLYRSCPVCNKHMNRKNFGDRSGVIVDLCKEHGIWFDAQELADALRWVREGGLNEEHERLREGSTPEQKAALNFPGMGSERRQAEGDVDFMAAIVNGISWLMSSRW